MTTALREKAAALRLRAADPHTDAGIAYFMLDTANDMEAAAERDDRANLQHSGAESEQSSSCIPEGHDGAPPSAPIENSNSIDHAWRLTLYGSVLPSLCGLRRGVRKEAG
jgi:hypothetical protein